ncbi:MAG: 4Fe-4S binding protein [Verrucomicrobiota bacterium]
MFVVDKEKCTGCGACIEVCRVQAISMIGGKARIAGNKCVDCGRCARVCPQGAIYPGAETQQRISLNQVQAFPVSAFGVADGRGLGRGTGRGLGRGPRDGRGRGRGGGGGRR